ncbi:MAG TPA: SRPBCC family protein [Bryobacteraceae bacterium]|nr:SRPBCC family protein [Bryobacteraceae bacterium]
MPVFRHEIFIERPVDAVFAAVADVHTHPKWQAGLLEADAAAGVLRVGGKGVEVRRVFGRVARFPYEITHCDPPNVWGFRVLDGPIRPAAVLSFKNAQSGTIITSQLTIPGLAGWLLGLVMLRQQKRNYQGLKRLLEAGKL